jgi:molybdopterin-synthase adenylyltransferase
MNDDELLRYSRHILLDGFDIDGQQKLCDSTALIVGLGGLGCPVALYLAASGVGHLVLADFDVVDISNLQRQIAHTEARIGFSKVESARQAIAAINSTIRVSTQNQALDAENLFDAVSKADVVVDCSDNFVTRFAINAACVKAAKPLVSGAAIRSEGQVAVFDGARADAPCYRCLYSDVSSNNGDGEQLACAEAGVLSPLVGVVGSMQALETVKLLSGFGTPLRGKLLVFDAAGSEWRQLRLPKDPGCPVCGGCAYP